MSTTITSVYSKKEKKIVFGTSKEISDVVCDNLKIMRNGITLCVPEGLSSSSSSSIHFKIKLQSTCLCGNLAKSTCGKCSRKKYCSKECQRTDWKTHKLECLT